MEGVGCRLDHCLTLGMGVRSSREGGGHSTMAYSSRLISTQSRPYKRRGEYAMRNGAKGSTDLLIGYVWLRPPERTGTRRSARIPTGADRAGSHRGAPATVGRTRRGRQKLSAGSPAMDRDPLVGPGTGGLQELEPAPSRRRAGFAADRRRHLGARASRSAQQDVVDSARVVSGDRAGATGQTPREDRTSRGQAGTQGISEIKHDSSESTSKHQVTRTS